LRSTDVGATAGVRVTPWLSFGSGVEYMTPRVTVLGDQPDFIRSEVSAEINTREPRGNPRQGVRYALAYQRYEDRDGSQFDFDRVEADVQHYISLYKQRRVLALRGFASVSDASSVGEVPFYFMRTLGGPDDLRGFRRFRFRDRNMLLLQAEYRWEIFTAVDGAIFYDAGKVASRIEDLNLQDLESDYGIGFRFGTRNGVFLRIEGAFGSSGGAHYIFRFGHVF
jgi:outer membrane protein assembly factor BamA